AKTGTHTIHNEYVVRILTLKIMVGVKHPKKMSGCTEHVRAHMFGQEIYGVAGITNMCLASAFCLCAAGRTGRTLHITEHVRNSTATGGNTKKTVVYALLEP
ncbi:unnamed protein product, partial [Ectocarpus sp. 13 AM-2016]